MSASPDGCVCARVCRQSANRVRFLSSASVDLQLPQVEGSEAGAPPETPPPEEPKPKFKERVVTSLGGEGGPAAFRRNRTQNGKSRSLRQRDGDDD